MQRSYLYALIGLVGALAVPARADAPRVTTTYFASGNETPPSCPQPVTVVRRMGDGDEEVREPLLACDGRVRPEAVRAVSILARPRGTERPGDDEPVRELHEGLLERLQALSTAFEGRPIEILSGFRPESAPTSRHHHARALDLRVVGVARERVRDVAARLPRTGVGWYPNSVFVHIDVREESAYWVDVSRPGEPPQYVEGAVPPPVSRAEVEVADADEAPPTPEAIEALQREVDDALAGIRVEGFE